MSYTHHCKIQKQYLDAIISGSKRFEVRLDDRDPRYEVGDILELCEFEDEIYTGRNYSVEITYILRDSEYVKEGYCILSLGQIIVENTVIEGIDNQTITMPLDDIYTIKCTNYSCFGCKYCLELEDKDHVCTVYPVSSEYGDMRVIPPEILNSYCCNMFSPKEDS